MSDDHTTVTYTVKELLSQLREDTVDGFRRMEQRLDTLASSLQDKADAAHVKILEERLVLIEKKQESLMQVDKYKKWLIGISITVGALAVSLVSLWISTR